MYRPGRVPSTLQDEAAGKHWLVSWRVGVYTDMFQCVWGCRVLLNVSLGTRQFLDLASVLSDYHLYCQQHSFMVNETAERPLSEACWCQGTSQWKRAEGRGGAGNPGAVEETSTDALLLQPGTAHLSQGGYRGESRGWELSYTWGVSSSLHLAGCKLWI